ncbi:glycosyltransferase family 2 protein [Proteiniphilum sp. UBA5384]|uniref:glycosyltransferase family 2 protein n=1 Tax=Proteiniphilum sp. UBA5384 TaxID=1947279 RepID=UPI0025CD0D9B|nr:glycosyltransferase family A protein [Proteiniphilum sp. UBA5384]
MNELISIIVPCYNQAEYMDECLQSVLDQTYANWECIMVNDGSPDNTEEIALKWQNRDSRFIYLKKENGGLSNARNYGIAKATGKFILPLDCDDKIGPDYILLAIKVFHSRQDIGVVYCQAVFFDKHTGKWKLPAFDKRYLLCSNHIFCSGIFLKDDWSQIGGYDENMKQGWEDWEFWINLLYTLNKNAYRINYTGFYYRRKENSMGDNVFNSQQTQLKIYEYVYSKHKALYDCNFPHPIIAYKKLTSFEKKFRPFIQIGQKISALSRRG